MSSDEMVLFENQRLGVARTTALLQGPHSPAQRLAAPAEPAVWRSRLARGAPRDVIRRAPEASLGWSGAGAFASTAAVRGAFPASLSGRRLPSGRSAAFPQALSVSLLAGSRPGRSHAERASPQGHVQAEQRLAASAGS